jgi:HD-GYP domain-containing protein (c-di-GMP phosphodiesterase class II)
MLKLNGNPLFFKKGGVLMVSFKYDLSHLTIEQTKDEKSLLHTLYLHDKESFLFSYYVALFNVAIIKQKGIKDKKIIHAAFKAGMFHDIGKLGMSSEFINYPGAYTVQMFNEMKNHPTGGAELLININSDPSLIISTRLHHCNVDTTGYPGGFDIQELPLFAKLTRISDSIDAFLSKRCYKEGGDSNEAYKDLAHYKGTSYDPILLEHFKTIHDRVIFESRRWGEDKPSKEIYMMYVGKIFAKEYYRENKENLIDLI